MKVFFTFLVLFLSLVAVIKKGDIVKCLPNVKHWHGASPNHSMTFIHSIPNTENGYLNWSNEVTNSEYFK